MRPSPHNLSNARDHGVNRFSGVQSAVMKIGQLGLVCTFLVLAIACGGSGTGSNGGGGVPTPPDATVTIASTSTGPFSVAMSTSFQPAEWDYQFFNLNPTATTTLGNL